MGERDEIEVPFVDTLCPRCNGRGLDPQFGSGGTSTPLHIDRCRSDHGGCGGSGGKRQPLLPASLAARQIALAVAVDRERIAYDQYLQHGEHEQVLQAWNIATDAVSAALAALREHPDYKRPE